MQLVEEVVDIKLNRKVFTFNGITSFADFERICNIIDRYIRPEDAIEVEWTNFFGGEAFGCFTKNGVEVGIQHGISEKGIYMELSGYVQVIEDEVRWIYRTEPTERNYTLLKEWAVFIFDKLNE